MKRTTRTCVWILAASTAVGTSTMAQESKDAKPAGVEENAGPNLRVRFLETRQKGEKTTTGKPSILLLTTGDEAARVFVGTQVALRTSDQGTPTVIFKNAGVSAEVSAQALPDGRYRLAASFEESSMLAGSGGDAPSSNGGNPILQVVKGRSVVILREGETVPFASAVDPVTGEVVRVELAIDVTSATKVVSATGDKESRLRARVVLHRRQGEKRIASRPYSVVVQAGEQDAANVFSGAMLPLESSYEGRPTVMLKDVGAGVRLAAHRIPDGRYRLDLSVSDGALSAVSGSPRVQAFQAESRIYLRKGETALVASAVDPQTGEVVEAELTLEADR
jgi:Flp pilus assembly secretin CpaC